MAGVYANVPILTANNYNNWKFRIMAILKKEQCEDVINHDPPTEDVRKKEFIVQDAKAQSFIIQGVSDKHLDIIKDCKTDKEQMKALKDVFVCTSSFTKLTLWRKLFSLKSSTNESLEDHFLKFDTITRDLQDMGSTIDETDRICHFLLSLPSQYDTVITALKTVKEVKMDFVKARLLDEELKFKSKSDGNQASNNDFSLKASTGCYNCGDKTHFKAQCPKRYNYGKYNRGRGRNSNRGRLKYIHQPREQANSAGENIILVAADFCNQEELKDSNVFILDSGASNHFIKEELQKYMHSVRKLDRTVDIYLTNGQILKASKKGELQTTCQGKLITIEALIVPGIKHNLLSAAKLTSRGHWIIVKKNKTSICGVNFTLTCKNINGLYILQVDSLFQEQCNVIVENTLLWHRRLGHAGKEALKQLGLPVHNGECSTCIEAKATRLPFYKNEKRSSAIGELIHSDICGPITPCTNNDEKYFQVILDDFSHFVVIKLLRNKNEAEGNLIEYVKEVERQHAIKVKRMRLDNGGEFSSNNFQYFCRANGIKLEYTMSYSPQMNGKAERMNRTLVSKIRSKIIDSNIPKFLWGEALKASVYELNRTPTLALERGKTPAMIWHGRNDISKLKIFGCRAWVTTIPKKNKLDSRAKRAVLIGYCGGGYRLWIPSEEIIVKSRDVRFEENIMEYIHMERDKIKNTIVEEDLSIDKQENNNQDIIEQEVEESETGGKDENENSRSSDLEINEEATTSKYGRLIKKPSNLNDYELYTAYCLLTQSTEEPESYKEVSEHPERKEAIKNELDSHNRLQTWTEAKLPEGQMAIETKWIFKLKEDGTKKARLVA